MNEEQKNLANQIMNEEQKNLANFIIEGILLTTISIFGLIGN